MILCIVGCCCCMYGREVLSLSLITKICMNGYLFAFGIHLFKGNRDLSCKAYTGELKGYINGSICFFSNKFIRCSNLISCIIQKCLSSFLINKGTNYCVLASNFNAIVTNRIN